MKRQRLKVGFRDQERRTATLRDQALGEDEMADKKKSKREQQYKRRKESKDQKIADDDLNHYLN